MKSKRKSYVGLGLPNTFYKFLVFLTSASNLFSLDQVSLQFLTFPKLNEKASIELRIGESETTTVEFSSSELSRVYEVPALETWIIGETMEAENGNESFVIRGQAASINKESQIILLIRRGNRTEDGFLVLPIDGTSSNFGPGKFLFVNASPTAVAVSMGGSQFALDPGRLRVVKPEPDVGERLSQVSLAYKKEGKWRRFSETRWPVSERSRALVFFYKDPRSKKVRIHAIDDWSVVKHDE